MLNLSQTISTLPFLQKPSGQQTNSFPLDAYNPNSNNDIGDFESGSKYKIIISLVYYILLIIYSDCNSLLIL